MKLKQVYRIISLTLAAVLLLSGCAQTSPEPPPQETPRLSIPISTEGTTEVSWQGEGRCYKMAFPDIDKKSAEVYVSGENLYTLVYHDQRRGLGSYQSDTTTTLSLNDNTLYTSRYVRLAAACNDGAWVLDDITDYKTSNITDYLLLKLDSNGEILSKSNVSTYFAGTYCNEMFADKDGMLYISLENGILVFDKNGSYLCKVNFNFSEDTSSNDEKLTTFSFNKLILGGDGNVYILSTDTQAVYSIDTENKTTTFVAKYAGYSICSGGGDKLFTLLKADGLYSVTDINETPTPFILWEECGISLKSPYNLKFVGEDKILFRDIATFYVLEPAAPSDIKQKKTLTMASVFKYSSSTFISDFNSCSNEYIIEIIDYTKGGELSTKEALIALNSDLILGKYPDLFNFMGMPERYYIDKGLVSDIYSFIDADTNIKREDFICLDQFAQNDRLYMVPSHFSLETAIGLYSRFGDRYGWTLDEYLKIESETSGDMMYNVTRERFLKNLASRYAATAIDWNARSCDFESEDFQKILYAAKNIKENPEDAQPLDFSPGGQRLKKGKLIALYSMFSDIWSMASMRVETGEKISFIGSPTPNAIGGTTINASNLTGICSKGNTEGAWEYIKYLLTTGSKDHSSYGISLNRDILEMQIERDIKESEACAGESITQEDVNQFYKLLENAIFIGTASEDVVDIIMEEATAYFASDKSLADTAKIIQNRVSLFLAE